MPTHYLKHPGPPDGFEVWEVGQSCIDSNGVEWLCTSRGSANQPGTAFLECGAPDNTSTALVGSSVTVTGAATSATLITAPPASASVAVTLGTPLQNTLGYDAQLVVFVKVTAATSATILAGVSSVSTPPVNPYVQSDSLTGVTAIPLYVPSNYYALVSTQGTITESATGMWCPV
jgi:hypothetical protein